MASCWLGAALLLALTATSCNDFQTVGKKLVVIGVDGMDPGLLRKFIDAGMMPNFKKLEEDGGFQALRTSNPPQSPVAWTDFITGLDSGGHGVFDFVHRNPEKYLPASFSTTTPEAEYWPFPGEYQLPSPMAEQPEPIRSGKAFWEILEDQGIRAAVYRMPATFPVQPTDQITMSDMGTTDILGSMNGDFSYYSTETPEGLITDTAKMHSVFVDDNVIDDFLRGPPQAFIEESPASTLPMKIYLDPTDPVALIDIDDGAARVVLEEGEWSDFVPVSFDLGLMQAVGGIVRFYLKEVRPTFKLYASPINIDPIAPMSPVTSPDDLSADIAEDLGYFYTQGLAENFLALEYGALDDADYLEQTNLVTDERLKLLDWAIDRFDDGLMFFYFSTIDLRSHMMWRHVEPNHPARVEELAAQFKDAIEKAYVRVDEALGHLRERVGEDTAIVILSDHGFSPFTREVELATWLHDEGYMALTEEGKAELEAGNKVGPLHMVPGPKDADGQPTLVSTIDWSKTKAYTYGFNAIYVNQQGREGEGSVPEAESDALLTEIAQKLEAWQDPGRGNRSVVKKVYRGSEIYHGERSVEGPDLVIGYERAYGASNEAATCEIVVGDAVHDNKRRWSGSHLMDPSVVPGVLLSNKALQSKEHGLQDVTATILEFFDVALPEQMLGKSVLAQ